MTSFGTKLWLVLGLGLLTTVGACAAGGDEDEGFSAADGEVLKADTAGNTKLLGTVQLGFGTRVLYTSSPRYRAVKFHAEKGTMLEVYVRSTQGDPMTWMTDSNFKVLHYNDDANEETNSDISIDSLEKTGDYYIVFRDKNLESHYFDVAPVQLNKPANAPKFEDVKAEYERLVSTNTLASTQVSASGLPFLAKGLFDRYTAEAKNTPGTQVGAYGLTVKGQKVWVVRNYLAGTSMSAISYCETGPMISNCEGSTEHWENCDY